MKPLPTPRQLRYLVALVEHQHFGRAAAACFVSQSAFSSAIRDLERLLGARLADRTNRQVTVTALGRDVAERARTCLAELDALVDMTRGGGAPLTGEVRLGVIPTIAPFLLPKLLPALRLAHPTLRLLLAEDQTDRIHAKLLDGQLDVLLLALPYDLRGVETMALFRDRFRLACRDGSTLVDPADHRLDRLHPESVLLLEDGHCLRNHALAACRLRDPEKLSRFAASSLLTLVAMIDADLGVSYLPEMAEGSPLLRDTFIRTYPLDDGAFRTIGLAWRRGSARAHEFRLLGSLVTGHR